MWDFESNQPLTIRDIATKFKLNKREHRAIESIMNSIPPHPKTILQEQNIQAPIGDWIGSFETNCQDAHLVVIFQSIRLLEQSLMSVHGLHFLPPTLQYFQVSANTRFVDMASPKGLDSAIRVRWFGFTLLTKGKNKPSFNAYIGKRDNLTMDPIWLKWKSREEL